MCLDRVLILGALITACPPHTLSSNAPRYGSLNIIMSTCLKGFQEIYMLYIAVSSLNDISLIYDFCGLGILNLLVIRGSWSDFENKFQKGGRYIRVTGSSPSQHLL